MSTVFISYRREGALVHARALYERLSREFGSQQVFIDLDGIDIGVDFVELIDRQLQGCRVLLALIDPEWLEVSDREGRRRLDNEADFVRVEIARALQRGITVAPILLDGAEMPNPNRLPSDLQALTRRNAMALDFRRFDSEVSRLIATIRRILESPNFEPSPPKPSPNAKPESTPQAQSIEEPQRYAAEPKQASASRSTTPESPASSRSATEAKVYLRWASALMVALAVVFGVWTISSRPTGETRVAAEVPAPRSEPSVSKSEPAQSALTEGKPAPTEPVAAPPAKAAPPVQDTASPSGKRWIMEFNVHSRSKACSMLAADPDFATAKVWQQDIDPRFSKAPSFAIRFGPTTDRSPLDLIRKRYLDRGVFSVITSPRNDPNERLVDCQKAEPDVSKIKAGVDFSVAPVAVSNPIGTLT